MKRLIWSIVAIGLLVWSGLAWAVYSLLGWGGNLASSNVDILTPNPEVVEWLSWLTMFGSDVAEWFVVGVWGAGVVLALVIGFAGTRLFPQIGQLAQKFKPQQ